jgi:hypothetical protein
MSCVLLELAEANRLFDKDEQTCGIRCDAE